MTSYKTYPLVADVKAQPHKRLLVRFRNGVTKLYDCRKILSLPAFSSLRNAEMLFRRAHADKHGYGVVWNGDLDLAESEIWIGGRVVREKAETYGNSVPTKAMKKPRAAKIKRRTRTAVGRMIP